MTDPKTLQTCARCAAVDEACLKECPDNSATTMGTPDPDLGRYLLVNEDGVELIDTDDPAEVVRRLGALWGSVSEQAEQMQQKIRELEAPRGEVAVWAVYNDHGGFEYATEIETEARADCTHGWSARPLYATPPVAAVVSDEMVEAAAGSLFADMHDGRDWENAAGPEVLFFKTMARGALTAALAAQGVG